ncbi:MAG TPA: MIP family channel protein [Acidimicrobiales bacterium]|nr:MIP family channel protein [Acidimicrobiales bacterium]
MTTTPKKFGAELLGTALLVYFAVGVATLSFGFGATGSSFSAGVVATALAFGLTLMALAYSLGPISGCHVNPAVTLGVWLAGGISLEDALGYWIAQFTGGILGALALWGTFSTSPLYSRSVVGLGTDGWGSASHLDIGMGGAFIVEVVLTALFVFVILAVTHKSAIGNASVAGLVIGLTLTIVHLIGIPITGTSVNPARALGPALVVGGTALKQVWLFIVAPLVGGALAGLVHLAFYGRPEPAPPAVAVAVDDDSESVTVIKPPEE